MYGAAHRRLGDPVRRRDRPAPRGPRLPADDLPEHRHAPAVGAPAAGLLQLRDVLIGLAGAAILAGWASDETEGRLDTVLSAPISPGIVVRAHRAGRVPGHRRGDGRRGHPAGGVGPRGRRRDRRRHRRDGHPRAWPRRRSPAIGLAAAGLRRLSVAAPVAAVVVLATFLLDIIGTALRLPGRDPAAVADHASRSADGRARTTRSASRPPSSWPWPAWPSGRGGSGAGTSTARTATAGPGPAGTGTVPGVDPFVIALVVVSAILHVAWNVRLKTAGDPLRAATIGMLAATVGIVPVGIAAWWWSGPAGPPARGHRPRRRVRGHRGGLLHPAVGGLPTGRPVGRLPDRPRDRAAAGRRHRGPAARRAARRAGLDRASRCCSSASCSSSSRGGSLQGHGLDPAVLFALATGVTIATYTRGRPGRDAAHRPAAVRGDPVGDDRHRARRCGSASWPAATLLAGGSERGPPGRRRRLADPRGVPAHPVRAERGAAVRGRAAARVGHGPGRGVGLDQARRGGLGRGLGATHRGVGGDRRRAPCSLGGRRR